MSSRHKNVAVFILDNSILADHFDKRNKVIGLVQSQIIDRDLYNTIIDGQIAKLKDYQLGYMSPIYDEFQ